MEQIPLSSTADSNVRSTIPWTGLHCLRRSLMERRMYYEAAALFRVEFDRTLLQEQVAQEFLKSIENIPRRRGRKIIEADVQLQWCTTYREMNMLSRAREELDHSQAAFDDWCSTFNVINKTIAPHSLLVQYERVRLELLTDSPEKLRETNRLIGLMLRAQTISKVRELLLVASECAFILFDRTNEMMSPESILRLHARLHIFNKTQSEDLCDLINDRLRLFSVINPGIYPAGISPPPHSLQGFLEWIDGFLEQYPYFRPPGEMVRLYRMRAHLLQGLQRQEESQKAERIANEYKTKGPSLESLFNLNLKPFNIEAERAPNFESTQYLEKLRETLEPIQNTGDVRFFIDLNDFCDVLDDQIELFLTVTGSSPLDAFADTAACYISSQWGQRGRDILNWLSQFLLAAQQPRLTRCECSLYF
jgi:hypothetical protein